MILNTDLAQGPPLNIIGL